MVKASWGIKRTCQSCAARFYDLNNSPIKCPKCGGEAEQVFGASGIVFKGSGFYNTDQRGGSSCTEATSGGCCEGCPNA